MNSQFTFYEFFAGGGMARAGLGSGWKCLFANDIDPAKTAAYAENWGADDLFTDDVAQVDPARLPRTADLAWASFPCQDLSLAGAGQGLGAAGDNRRTRSGAFWLFHEKMAGVKQLGRAPRVIMLENVPGVLTARDGRDFAALVGAMTELGYRVGALVVDARLFLPQSRPRVFFLCLRDDLVLPAALHAAPKSAQWSPPALLAAKRQLSAKAASAWIDWRLPAPPPRRQNLVDLIETAPAPPCRPHAQTQRLLDLMADHHRAKIAAMAATKTLQVGTLYRRMRRDETGARVQRAEVRFDGLAGCLRTPAGGSSRQSVLLVEGDRISSRLLTAREAARLMGLPDTYQLPARFSAAYKLCGDGLAAPVVRYLAEKLIEPLLAAQQAEKTPTENAPATNALAAE